MHGIAESVLRMMAQGVDVGVFDGFSMRGMFPIHTAPALSASEMNPIGRFMAGPSKTITLNQSFDEHGAITVQTFPVNCIQFSVTGYLNSSLDNACKIEVFRKEQQ
jgi:hypothetical protein